LAHIETEITFDNNNLKSIKITRADNVNNLSTFRHIFRSDFSLRRYPPSYVPPSTEQYECGIRDESQHVEVYNGALGVSIDFVRSHQSPVGQIQWNNNLHEHYENYGTVSDMRWGSGTMISEDLFLTAGHCFYNIPIGWQVPLSNNNNQPIPPHEVAKNMHINFNHQYAPNEVLRQSRAFAILELLEYEYNYISGLDYAIVKVDGNPGNIYGYTNISDSNVREGDQVCIIGHPQGNPKKIHGGPITYVTDNRIGYNTIDTHSGSSGSGILHSPSGKLAGIHTNGGCGTAVGHNYGFMMTSLINRSSLLQNLL
jgi:V8-like Glu-specific endopeptidase